MRRIIFAIDFDGTIVQHKYPRIGKLVPGAKELINILSQEKGYEVFLYTMRDGKELEEAREFCKNNEIAIGKFNESPAQFSSSPKQYATMYIDDAALGCPLKEFEGNVVVDWWEVAYNLAKLGYITEKQYDRISKIFLRSTK